MASETDGSKVDEELLMNGTHDTWVGEYAHKGEEKPDTQTEQVTSSSPQGKSVVEENDVDKDDDSCDVDKDDAGDS